MKRYVVGTLLLSIVMFVQLFGNIPVFADTFVPTSSYDFTSLADLGYALIGGAEFDFEGSPYVIDDYNSLSAEQKEIQKSLAARQFLMDYMESRGIAYEEDGELHPGSAYYTIAFGLAGQEFFEAFQTASAVEQENMTYNMPISPSRFADWAGYNKYWFNRYANDFALTDDPVFVPDVPIEYQDTVDLINADPFCISENNGSVFKADITGSLVAVNGPYWDYSLGNFFNPADFIYSNGNTEFKALCVNTLSVYINYNETTHQYVVTCPGFGGAQITSSGVNIISCLSRSTKPFSTYSINSSTSSYKINPGFSDTIGNYGTIQNALNAIKNKFAFVNLFVNGEIWALASNPAPANPTIPDFPDIINQESGELAYDIAMPKTQDYSGSFDLTSLFDAIREGIAGASDGDLTTGSTIGSLDVGRTYTGEGIDIQDRVIDLTSSRVFDGTLTDDTTGRLPKPPIVPPAVSAGLGGVTVLAKYVDATQCILPEDLMTAFWGCVWILIILGLIKNLHR